MALSKQAWCGGWVVSVLLMGLQASAAVPEALISRFVADTGFNGVIVVATDEGLVHQGAYGHADIEAGTPTAFATRYQLGSISKYVASLVVLRLVDEGTLSLTRPISEYLPDLRGDVGSRVTLHHLLAHTSGVPNDVIAAFRKDRDVAKVELSTATAVERYASGALQFEPGSRFDYSHSNWILVRAIIERASGRSYEENVQRLLHPLKLRGMGTFAGDFGSVSGGAVGYASLRPEPKRASTPTPAFMACAGGMFGTAADLLTLTRAVHGGQLLSRDSVQRLGTPYTHEDGVGYAYGGHVRTLKLGGKDEVVSWLSGSNGPFKTRVSRVLSSGLTVILMSNTTADLGRMGALTEDLLHGLSGEAGAGR
ncbi:beta-lactamase family protein [Pyxidicoccus fallax]|uniref:Beta-lactamase family protein n=1 Tax=Pyxidicoccus fallax TaxID=394095 RepID=A0A848LDJ4_9BACT|nr:serine hydrolase domain-containing protein [Pyxidicoccus fallax]NMO14885.1 beta-lactamase family protein [Pyxidicoccus fallax]NPC77814.1 beta-lactamase family protein [Pyxidicoccus fallax]